MDHGLDWSNRHLQMWAVGLPAMHILCTAIFRAMNVFPEVSKKGSRGSDIVAFALVACILVTYVTIAGILGWWNLFDVLDTTNIYENKFYGRSTYVENHLVYPMVCYQIWNLTTSLILTEFRTPDAIGHHVVTATLAYFGFAPYAQYYALFYFGVAEASSIPLNLLDVFKYLPHLTDQYPAVQGAVKASFGISFFIIRMFYWPVLSYELFFGCLELFQSGKAHSTFVVGFFLGANLFLTFLQFYWGFLIARKALGLGGPKGGTKKKA